MHNDGRVYKFDGADRALKAAKIPEHDKLNNGSTTDTKQWCVLHHGHCHDVVPIRRHFANHKDEIFHACQKCLRDLRKAGLMEESKYAGLPCGEVVVPRGLYTPDLKRSDRHAISPLRSEQVAYEVTLDALQVKYLRALGLRVIPA